ncbi:MAG: cation-translocating P-type ATPase [Pirellulales bacterium]|nr:cation-translocating P-type ATPase [Pirellulales bacterium]
MDSPWSETVEHVARRLQTNIETGLSASEVQQRLKQCGWNWLREAPPRSVWKMFLGQLIDWMIGLLVAAAAVSLLLGDWHDSVLILAIVLANALIGFLQERRAEQAVAALKKLAQPTARVWRDGKLSELPAKQLVPGDIIELIAGALVPADGRLIMVADLQIDEALLTGESMSVDKQIELLAAATPLPDRTSMVFAGTTMMRGHGKAIVTATGMRTEMGKIATLLEGTTMVQTPLQLRLAAFSKQLAILVVAISGIVFVVGILRGNATWESMFLVAVSLAVAAIPEGLPAVITVALALGSLRMAQRKAIVRQLAAVETLGSINVICSDKTGTLTQNRMSVSDIIPHREGDFIRAELLRASVLCNNAQPVAAGQPIGSATESAMLIAATAADLDPTEVRQQWPREVEFPFHSDRKRMSTVHRSPEGKRIICAKGAAEAILGRSTHLAEGDGTVVELQPSDKLRLEQQLKSLTARGRRLLAVATKYLNEETLPQSADDAESKLAFLGWIGLVDPARPEARAAIERCRTAGIRAVMITGDHRRTALAIAEDIGLWQLGDEVMSGEEIDRLDDAELERCATRTVIYARVSPVHKLRIVRAHQACGSVVAMTGDGVNDAPALKQADIGVAMGITGADVSKEASRMILADDNFATIVAAVEEGRVVYDNIRKFIVYLLTGNLCEILVILSAILLGLPLPLLPVHLLWINLVTDGLPALALAFEPAEPGTMQRPPRWRNESIFAGGLARGIVLVATIMAAVCLAIFWWALPSGMTSQIVDHEAKQPAPIALPQTMVFVTLSFAQFFHVLALRSSSRSFFSQAPWTNWRLAVSFVLGAGLQLAIVYVPRLASWFHCEPLPAEWLAVAIAVSTAGFWVVEAGKWVNSVSLKTGP